MQIRTCRHGRCMVVRLIGEFDLSTAPEFRRVVDDECMENLDRLIVDLGEVTFIDSSGLGALLGRYRRLQSMGKRFALAAPSHRAREILGLAGIGRTIDIFPSASCALEGEE
ncbi:MAG: STAS domain-containing protein [Bacillota bacterium]